MTMITSDPFAVEDSYSIKKRRRQFRRSTKEVFNPGPSSSSSDPAIYRKKYFAPHLWEEAAEQAVQRGDAFKSIFRVNAHNRMEAYCTITGVPVDVLIAGDEAQNRAIEGDEVVVVLDPVYRWVRLKSANSNVNASFNSCSRISGPDESPSSEALDKVCAIINSNPLKRPTGRVLAILKRSPKREAVIGFLSLNWPSVEDEDLGKVSNWSVSKNNKCCVAVMEMEWVQLKPTDSRFPKMLVNVRILPEGIKELVNGGDAAIERVLVAANLYEWNDEALYPEARIVDVFGSGGGIESRMSAILFENSICDENFSPELQTWHPAWKIPDEELKTRMDFRKICCFTIDPRSAAELDDALSVEILPEEVHRVGIHIADVSYFVLPDSALDEVARLRCTSVYALRRKLPMLPPELTEKICSLIPGKDRLALSIICDIDRSGRVIDRWIGRSVISSCCKLSYDSVQAAIDNSFDVDKRRFINIFGRFSMKDVTNCLKILYKISKKLRETRFNDGALQLETIKLGFLFDENGVPLDSKINERLESSCLVEEFMLLANRSVAEIISQAFPNRALLRRHPEPNARKLKELDSFCRKLGFDMDSSSSRELHLSLSRIKEHIRDDPALFDIVTEYASKPMQSASYFCTGELEGRRNEWGHYALSVPLYTHFTSPIRRYSDIIVHRTLCAVLHAEKMFHASLKPCFTGLCFNRIAAESPFGREALLRSASKFKLPGVDNLGEVAARCNEKKVASRHVEEAGERLCLWALLRRKEAMVAEARVLSLGPRFMCVYIRSFALERRIYYDDVDCLAVDWLEMTGTLVLDLVKSKINGRRRVNNGGIRLLDDAVLLTEPSSENDVTSDQREKLEEVFFPLVLRSLSSVPVLLYAFGGDDGPIDIGAKLYVSSYCN